MLWDKTVQTVHSDSQQTALLFAMGVVSLSSAETKGLSSDKQDFGEEISLWGFFLPACTM